MAFSNEDMKIIKFKIMIEDVQKYLMKGYVNTLAILIINNDEYQNIYLESMEDVLR